MPFGFAAREVVRARELQRRLHGLAAAGHRIDPRLVDRQQWREIVGIHLEHIRRERRGVGVREPLGLLGQDARDLPIAVADVHHNRTAGGIEIPVPLRIGDPRTLGPNRHRRRTARPPGKHVTHSTISSSTSSCMGIPYAPVSGMPVFSSRDRSTAPTRSSHSRNPRRW